MKLLYLDTETTQFNDKVAAAARIMIQFAAIAVDTEQGITPYTTYCRPPKEQITPQAMATHGIVPEDIEDKPTFDKTEVYTPIKQMIEDGYIVVAHNSKFDIDVLRREGINFNQTPTIDTLKVARFLNDRQALKWESCSLQYLKYYYRLDKEPFPLQIEVKAHDAMSDVVDLMKLTQLFKKEFGASYDDMVKLTEMDLYLTYMPSGRHKGTKIVDLNENQLKWYMENDFNADVRYTCAKILGEV